MVKPFRQSGFLKMSDYLYKKLEFDKVLSAIAGFTKSDASRRAVFSISPLKSIEQIQKRQLLIREIRFLSEKGKPLSITPFKDISLLIHKVNLVDSVLEPMELYDILVFLKVVSSVFTQIKEASHLHHLKELISGYSEHPEIISLLEKSVDSEGNLLDSASWELSELRRKIKRLEQKIRSRLSEIIKDEKVSKFLQDTFITQRSGRWVIPVRMDSKGQVPGVVHDISKSGETAFLEPLNIIGLSNELENVIAEAKAEEIRILKRISKIIREISVEIEAEFGVIVFIDMLNAISIFAEQFRMEFPEITDKKEIKLIDARHPILEMSLKTKEMPRSVIPVSVYLGKNDNVMVITGPNAGGKTITIKTVGLLTLMALCGMPVSSDSSSHIPFVKEILVDIGDSQSIEDNLSTFSAHISQISEIIKRASSDSLILIDELGTGTDPEEGAALSCAVLKELRDKKAFVFATTHLTEIKAFVYKTEGMINASMEFDHKTLTPLYKLKIGEPGRSYAFQTAERYGLPVSIIESARSIMGVKNVELEELLRDLEEKKRYYEMAISTIEKEKKDIEKKKEALNKILSYTEEQKKEILLKAHEEALGIVTNAKRDIAILMDELKKKDISNLKKDIKDLEIIQRDMLRKIKEIKAEEPSVAVNLKEGDRVYLKSFNTEATIVRFLGDERLKVRKNSIEFEVSLQDVRMYQNNGSTDIPGSINLIGEYEQVETKINLIGLRVEDALRKLEKFLDKACLSGLSEVAIIHGLGTGALSRAVKEHLSHNPIIKDYRKGMDSEGGAGVTIAILK